jgi:hypothetical protein
MRVKGRVEREEIKKITAHCLHTIFELTKQFSGPNNPSNP